MDKCSENILLSICIPTYNRGEILDKTIQGYVTDQVFDERVELVISDNCSTDNTRSIVEKYMRIYKNIKYNCNDENIIDANFIKVLSLGRGKYLKLMNDTVTLNSGVLKSMLDIIILNMKDLKPIFFYQNISFLNSNKILCCSTLNELVSNVSFYIGWITNFGVWREDFELLENKDRLIHLHFIQTDLTIRLLNRNKCMIIYFADYYKVANLINKGGYNLFHIFGLNYLAIFEEYLKLNILKKKIFRVEKYRLFRYFLIGWYRTLILFKDKRFAFEKRDAIKILLRNYRYCPYFYLGIIYLYSGDKIIKKIKRYLFPI